RVTGVGRYLAGLLHEWAIDASTSVHQFVLYAPELITLRLDARRFPTRLVRGGSGTWWEQVRAPRAARLDHLDVWFAPAYSAPLALKVPIVVTIHDLSFDAHPEWFRRREGARRRRLPLQPPSRGRSDSGGCADRAGTRGCVARHRRRQSQLPARGSAAVDCRRGDRGAGALARIRLRGAVAGPVCRRAGVRLSVGVRRAGAHAARG